MGFEGPCGAFGGSGKQVAVAGAIVSEGYRAAGKRGSRFCAALCRFTGAVSTRRNRWDFDPLGVVGWCFGMVSPCFVVLLVGAAGQRSCGVARCLCCCCSLVVIWVSLVVLASGGRGSGVEVVAFGLALEISFECSSCCVPCAAVAVARARACCCSGRWLTPVRVLLPCVLMVWCLGWWCVAGPARG